MINIREESKKDIKAIWELNLKAFGQPEESTIIGQIRNSGTEYLSLVAEFKKKIVGHIFFSPASIDDHSEIEGGVGLAPMAVLPKFQMEGIGKMLVDEGIRILKERGVPFIIVLGHPNYYPKFGFEKASKYNLQCQWQDIPDEAFMIIILDKEKMKNVKGIVRYREEWNEAV